MQMEKKDLPKQQRRKRKDPQSRDFKCKCGKSYLSYAAVYTHVKNKHDNDKQFEDSIMKPQKQKLKRGRPKDKKQIVLSSQTQALSICQETTLLVYEQLKQKKQIFNHNIILEGNQQMNESVFIKQYRLLNQQRRVKINLLEQNKQEEISNDNNRKKSKHNDQEQSQQQQDGSSKIFAKFIKGVIKHFSAQIAAKVAYVINYFAQLYELLNFQDQNEIETYINELNAMNIWHGQDQINTCIYDSMVKWISIVKKNEPLNENDESKS